MADASAPDGADLRADTRGVRVGEGRYALELSDAWDYVLPSGGVIQTCALRAAADELAAEELRLCSATAVFCAPLQRGALELEVVVLRRGVATAQVRVDVRNRGAELGAVVTATFASPRRGPDVRGAAMPRTRAVGDALRTDGGEPASPHARFRFYRQVECRIADGERTWLPEFEAGPARYARWFRYRVAQRTPGGLLDRLALPPLIDTMPTALQRAIGPGDYQFYAPSLDLTLHVVDDTAREWLLLSSYVRRALDGVAVGEMEVWDDEGRFLAFGTQAMYLKRLTGAPPAVDASRR
ncbi:MAG: thioesterase family protein [Kofleriaceae bacterium]